MRRAEVVGHLWVSRAHPALEGYKILILREHRPDGTDDFYLAVDTVDAGIGDEVLTVSGSASRQSAATVKSPADTAIIAVVDPRE